MQQTSFFEQGGAEGVSKAVEPVSSSKPETGKVQAEVAEASAEQSAVSETATAVLNAATARQQAAEDADWSDTVVSCFHRHDCTTFITAGSMAQDGLCMP